MPDPFTRDDPFGGSNPYSPRRRAAYPPLPDAETDSAIGALTGGALSGLGYLGSTLDKFFGGRAVRGALAGKPREVLSAIPGSDILGLTDEADTTSGEDLLRNIGYDPSQGNWFERNLVGPAVEVGLDPSTYLGGIGAVTRAGKAASKTGSVTRGFLPAVRAGERSLIYGLRGPAVADAAQGAVNLASKFNVGVRSLPKVGSKIAAAEDYLGTLGRRAHTVGRTLFDTKAGPVANETVQAANESARVPARQAAVKGARGETFDLYQQLQPVLDAGADPEDVYRYVTQLGEGVTATPGASIGPHQGALDAVGNKLRSLYDAMPPAERALGLKSAQLGSAYDLDYMTRRANRLPSQGGGGMAQKVFRTTHPSQIRRKDIFDVPGGSVQLEDWIRDPAMSGAGRTLTPDLVKSAILQSHMDAAANATTGTFPLNFPKIARRKAKGLTGYLGRVKDEFIDLPDRTEPAVPFFNRDIPANFLARATRGADVTSAAQAVHDVIARVGVKGLGDVPATTTLAKAGLRGEGAYRSALKALKQDPDAIIAAGQQAAGNKPFDPIEALRQELKTYLLPQAEHAAATRYMNRFTTPEEMGPIRSLFDSTLNLFKAGTYSIWPASHGRNFFSGLAENALEGTHPLSPAYGEAGRLMRGGATDPTTTGQLRELFTEGIIGQPQGELQQRVGVPVSEVGVGNPALPKKGVLAAAKPWLNVPGAIKDPFGVAGVGGRLRDTNPFVRAGREVGTAVEDKLRVAQFLDRRRKGYDAASAAALVKKTHIDYGDLTDFEKNVAKRYVPFYSFSSRNIPKQVGRAVTSPAKVSAPLRLAGGGEDQGYVPEYLRSGLALPVGEGQDGTQRYLSQLGLPFEEAFSRLKVGRNLPDTAWKTLEGLLGTLRPEIRYPLENATGKQFFTGRDLADLRPGTLESLGGLLDEDQAGFLSQLLSATPASRGISTANRLLDERKGTATKLLSLLTGAKLTDVDTDKWRAIDARHQLERIMQHEPNIRESVDYYARPEAKAAGEITPDQADELRLYAALKLRAREAAELKRRVGVQPGGG